MLQSDDKITDILCSIKKQIILLQSKGISAKYELTLELNMTQGGIGDAFLNTKARERITK